MEYSNERRVLTRNFLKVNNDGIHHLRKGHYEDATYCFIEAMQGINRQMISPPANVTPSSIPNESITPSYFVSLEGQDAVTSSPPSSHSLAEGGDMFLFRSALLVSDIGEAACSSDCSSCCPSSYSSNNNTASTKSTFIAVLYNLALSYHLNALETRDLQSLTQALSYYQIAYRVVVSGTSAPLPQVMAIFNNIGHVHRLLHDEDNAKSCFQHLLSVMMLVQQTGEIDRIKKWDGFFSNVTGLIGEGPNPASAA